MLYPWPYEVFAERTSYSHRYSVRNIRAALPWRVRAALPWIWSLSRLQFECYSYNSNSIFLLYSHAHIFPFSILSFRGGAYIAFYHLKWNLWNWPQWNKTRNEDCPDNRLKIFHEVIGYIIGLSRPWIMILVA